MKRHSVLLRILKPALGLGLAGLFLAPLASCALYRNDQCYVEDWRYKIAHDFYIESGSLDVVKERLHDFQWRRCEINECVYRLEKEFEVVSP